MNVIPDSPAIRHGGETLPLVEVRGHSLPLQAGNAFLGDLASGSRFRELLREERHRIEVRGAPPFGHDRTHEIGGDELDAALLERATTPEGRIIDQAIQTFSRHLADVLVRFLDTADWEGTQRIACGGGLMEGLVGAEIVERTTRLLQEGEKPVPLSRLHHAPDEAGMIGWAYAAPSSVIQEAPGFVAVDIGGTNIRWSTVRHNGAPASSAEPEVVHHQKWGHAEEGVDREALLDRLVDGIAEMSRRAEQDGLHLSALIGISCPGVMRSDGKFSDGCQNLPGAWCDPSFSLPQEIDDRLKQKGIREKIVALHNDAVIQALSEWPRMKDVERWAAVTMGTGLGNCSFVNR